MSKRRIFYGWWVMLSSTLIAVWGGGLFYSFTAFVNPIVGEFGWSYAAVSLAAALRSVEMGGLAPVAGFLSDKLGPRKIAFCSAILGGTGLVLLGNINSLTMFYVAFGILSLGFSGFGQVVLLTAVANWFRKNVSKAMGFAVAGYGMGGIFLPIIVSLIAHYGWRLTFVIIGIVTWLIVIPLSLLLRHKPEQYGYLPDGETTTNSLTQQSVMGKVPQAEVEISFAQALRTRAFWLLSLTMAIFLMTLNGVTVHVMPYLANAGFQDKFGALIAMSIPLSSVAGRILFGWLGDAMDKRLALAIDGAMQATGLFFFCYGHSAWQFIVFLIFYGPGSGGMHTLRASILREHFGRGSFGAINGMVAVVFTVGAILGPVFAGWVFDTQGSYRFAWLIFAIATTAAMLVSPAIKLAHKNAPATVT